MKSVLEEFYIGNIIPNNQYFNKNSNLGKAMNIVETNEEKLLDLLKGKERELFIAFSGAQSEINGITAVQKFIEGFKLGMKFAIEGLIDSNND